MFSLSKANLRISLASLVVAGLALAPTAGKADPTIPNSLTLDVTNTLSVLNPLTIGGKLSNAGAYNLDYTFTVTASSFEWGTSAGSAVTLYQETAPNSWTKYGTYNNNGTSNQSSYLSAGTYELAVTGNALSKGQTVTTTIGLSPAPIPAALPLFGSALVGVGLLSRRRQKRVSA
jgi:hypothetical protein